MPRKNQSIFSWSPIFCWKVLRHSKKYQEAVETFRSDLLSIRNPDRSDTGARNLFEKLGENDPFYSDEDLKKISQAEPPEISLDGSETANIFMYRSGDPRFDRHAYGIDPTKEYLCKFLRKFGHVLRFPIPPSTDNPNAIYLQALWNLRPARVIDGFHLDLTKIERLPAAYMNSPIDDGSRSGQVNALFRLGHMPLEVNLCFSDKEIIDYATKCIEGAVKSIRQLQSCAPLAESLDKFTMSQDDLQRYIQAWQEYRTIPKDRLGKTEGMGTVARKIFPHLKRQDLSTLRKSVERKVKDMDKLLSILEGETVTSIARRVTGKRSA